MPRKFQTPINLVQNELQNPRVHNLAGNPSTPVIGQIYFDTVAGHLYVWTGSAWEQASGVSGGTGIQSVAVATANGFQGSASGTSPATITLQVTVAGLLRGVGNALVAATGADLPALNTITAPTGDLSLNTHKIINLVDPIGPQDAATKNYVDAALQGVETKPTAAYATTGALPGSTYANGASGVGATLTGTANGALAAIDGQTPAAGDLVLVKNQATAAQNGLYTVTQVGDSTHPFILTRHVSLDQAAEFGGALIAVEAGATNGGSLWLCAVNSPTVGTTAVTFTEINKAADLTPGTGIAIVGNQVSISGTYAGQASITTVGIVTAGTWRGTAVDIAYGGTNATTAAGARTNLGATGKYQATIGNGAATSFTITQATHGLAADRSILVQVEDDATGDVIFTDVNVSGTGTVTISFSSAPAANAYRVVLIG